MKKLQHPNFNSKFILLNLKQHLKVLHSYNTKAPKIYAFICRACSICHTVMIETEISEVDKGKGGDGEEEWR